MKEAELTPFQADQLSKTVAEASSKAMDLMQRAGFKLDHITLFGLTPVNISEAEVH